MATKSRTYLKDLLNRVYKIAFPLFKIMIPLLLAVEILDYFGVVEYISFFFEPLMSLMGLDADAAIIWTSAIVVNIYAAIGLFIALAPEYTVAQVTCLSVAILIAHNLIVEVFVYKPIGLRPIANLAWRIGFGFLAAVILNQIYSILGVYQDPAVVILQSVENDGTILNFAIGLLLTLTQILIIIFLLLIALDILEKMGLMKLFDRFFGILLKFTGIGPNARRITVIGMLVGLSYGAGLLISEVRNGHVSAKDTVGTIYLLGLSHAIIEDSLLLLSIGASLSGVFFWRLAITILAILALMYAINRFGLKLMKYLIKTDQYQYVNGYDEIENPKVTVEKQ